MTAPMRLTAVTLDCADPLALADFYGTATGLGLDERSTGGEGPALAFQRVDGYRAPRRPGQQVPQQLHLDFHVADLDTAETRLLALGAVRPEPQPLAERWRVLLDPAGHPFCLTAK